MHERSQRSIRAAGLAVAATCALITSSLLNGGCNTIEGVGEDVSAAGQTLADWAARDEKR